MASNSTSDNPEFRLAAVQSLGFLCEFLDLYFEKDLGIENIGSILHSMICNIDKDRLELTKIAVKAL